MSPSVWILAWECEKFGVEIVGRASLEKASLLSSICPLTEAWFAYHPPSPPAEPPSAPCASHLQNPSPS